MSNSERNSNQVPSLQVKSNAADSADVILWADPTTHRLLVDATLTGGGTSMTDDAAFTPGTTEITPIGAFFDDVSPDSVNEGDGGVVRMSANRNLYVTIRDAAGNERGLNVAADGSIGVTGTFYQATQPVSIAAPVAVTGTFWQTTQPVSIAAAVAVTGTFWQATQPVSLASVPSHAVTNAGTFAVQVDGAALTALQLIDDTVYTDDAAFTPGTSKLIVMGAEADETAPDSVDEGDAGALRMTLDRRLRVANKSIEGPGEPTIDSYSHVAINLTTGADQVLVSSAANKQIWVYGYGFTCGDADGQTVSLQDEDNTALTGIMEFVRYGGISVSPSGNFSMPIFKLGTDKDLEIDITGGDVDGWLVYAIVSV